MQTIVADFDGVIHSYIQPWTRADVIPDQPVEGAIEWLREMADSYNVVIMSTRAASSDGQAAIRNWLMRNGCAIAMTIKITDQKPPALLYIDDRGWNFDGTNFPTLREIADFQTWNSALRAGAQARGNA